MSITPSNKQRVALHNIKDSIIIYITHYSVISRIIPWYLDSRREFRINRAK